MKSLIPTLAVDDVDASLAFYTDVLGFTTGYTLPGPDGTTLHASVDRGEAHIMFGKFDPARDGEGTRGAGVTLYFTVGDDEDIDAYFERVRAAGAAVVQGPTDQFWGHRDWTVADPDGFLLTISKVTGPMDLSRMPSAEPALATAD